MAVLLSEQFGQEFERTSAVRVTAGVRCATVFEQSNRDSTDLAARATRGRWQLVATMTASGSAFDTAFGTETAARCS
ncbi:hypothetical protein ACFQ07_09285, partial [Actinomadura adrarensis]